MAIKLITDSCCDLKYNYLLQNDIIVKQMTFRFKDMELSDDLGQTYDYKEFYNALREGEMASTAQVNAFTFEEEFEKQIKEGNSIIYIGISSALSGTYNSACIAKEEIIEKYPDADISIVDSKCASMGIGLLLYYVNEMIKSHKRKDEIVSWIESNKLKINHWFTVEDLNHLHRGGRVSKTAATMGSLLNIKPILKVDDEGRLISVGKVKGRKKSITSLLNSMEENIVNPEEQVIFISHGDCLEEAEILKEKIKEKINVKDIIINYIGPAVGTHSGPGTIALFFLGNKR